MIWSQKWAIDASTISLYSDRLSKGYIKEGDIEPVLGPFQFYVDAFRELNSCRSGMGNGPIIFTSIAEYVRIYELKYFDDFLYFIRKLDDKLMELENGRKKSNKSNKSGGKVVKP